MKIPTPTRTRWRAWKAGEGCPLCSEMRNQSDDMDHRLGREIRRDEDTITFFGDNQHVSGYCLVVVRQHVAQLHELDAQVLQKVLRVVTDTARALEAVYGPNLVNVEFQGNLVPHLHAHIKPRFDDDGAPFRRIPHDSPAHLLTDSDAHAHIGSIRRALAHLTEEE